VLGLDHEEPGTAVAERDLGNADAAFGAEQDVAGGTAARILAQGARSQLQISVDPVLLGSCELTLVLRHRRWCRAHLFVLSHCPVEVCIHVFELGWIVRFGLIDIEFTMADLSDPSTS
jgi:hypothetical protein